MPRIAVYPGSFAPFTIGHLDIVARTLRLFDKVIIAIGVNLDKPDSRQVADETEKMVRSLFEGCDSVDVAIYTGLTADFVHSQKACGIIRGVRNALDFEYERTLADTNAAIAGVETVMLCARPELSFVSSSMVRELRHFNYDVSGYIPTRDDVEYLLDQTL